MTATSPHTAPHAVAARGARRAWGVLVAEGVLLMLIGIAAIVFPAMAGIAAAVLFGWVLIIGGVSGLVSAFATRPHVHFAWSLISSVLTIAAGLISAFFPFVGAAALVIVIAAWLTVHGVANLMIGLNLRRMGARSWGWPIVSAVVDWVLALAVLLLSPTRGLVLVGIIVGVDLLFSGLALLALGGSLRRAQA
jgi:uncharacterized membrane protein HdeD (DUF308 family)